MKCALTLKFSCLAKMVEETQNYLPFPHGSINLVVGPSNVGKSSFVTEILANSELYFTEPLTRIVIVNCHSAVSAQYQLETSEISVVQCLLSNFEVEQLEPGDMLIFEDVQEINATIKLAVTTIVHHLNLSGCFIICHSILGSRLFEILQFCHQIILFLTSSAVSRLALYIVRAFFVDEELKRYLKTIIATAENQQAILHLLLNPIAGARTPNHLALSHLTHLNKKKGGFCVIYPNLRKMKNYEEAEKFSLTSDIEDFDNLFIEQMPENLHPNSYLMINSQNVVQWKEQQQQQQHKKSKNTDNCSDGEENWLFAVTELESDIEESFPAAKIFKAKSLARELLKNSNFCLGLNGRTMHFLNKPKWTFSVLDFLSIATRMAGPKEMDKINTPSYKLYRAVTKSLLSKDCPTHFIKNKILLSNNNKKLPVAMSFLPPVKKNKQPKYNMHEKKKKKEKKVEEKDEEKDNLLQQEEEDDI